MKRIGTGHRGLGLQVIDLPCGTFFGHSGSTPGYKAAAFKTWPRSPVAILTNSLTLDDLVGNAAAVQAFDESSRWPLRKLVPRG